MKLLFLLKRFTSYGHYGYSVASGLFNSAKFVVDMLNAAGVEAKLVSVTDNNDIDREVAAYKPTDVLIEALWVVPEKFDVLKKLHPGVRWIVRLHSDIPFLASEGIAIEWIFGYLRRGVKIAPNSPAVVIDLRAIAPEHKHDILYLPNFYPVHGRHIGHSGQHLDIGCFGALRPMKNQLIQAIASVRYADKNRTHLNFHINTREELGGDSVLRNLQSLFANTEHTLVEHPWVSHESFKLLVSEMDLALCVSFSETFCITAADAASTDTPLVCSGEIPWASSLSVANTNSAEDIMGKIGLLLSPAGFLIGARNRKKLKRYSERSKDIWLRHFGS